MIVVAVLSVVLVGLLVWLILSRAALGAARSEAAALREQVEKATADGERAEAELAQVRTQSEAAANRAKAAEAERDRARDDVTRVSTERAETETTLAEAREELRVVHAALTETEALVDGLTAELAEARTATEQAHELARAAEATLAETETRLVHDDAGAHPPSAVESGAGELDPLGVWALESVRLDRLWRDQLATGPEAPSPFSQAEDPALAGVQILVEALRESSGTPVELVWDLDVTIPPAHGVRVLRAVEELLSAARTADSATLVVARQGDDVEIWLRTEPAAALPSHLAAALAAAGLTATSAEDGTRTRVPWPAATRSWG